MSTLINSIKLFRGVNVSKTLTFYPDISSAAFLDQSMYSKITSSPMKQKALDRTIDYVDIAGLDNAGAEGAEIS